MIRLVPILPLLLCSIVVWSQDNLASRTHGTINVLLANKSGLVLLTDSRISNFSGQAVGEGKKLFVLDDRTICSIAGFYSDSGPYLRGGYPVTTFVPGIVEIFLNQFRPDQSTSLMKEGEVKSKLSYLSEVYRFALERVATLNYFDGKIYQPSDVIITVAGYEGDTIHVEGLSLKPSLEEGRWIYLESERFSESVGDKLVKRVAGISSVADQIFTHPASYSSSPILAHFAEEVDRNLGTDLDIRDLKQIADQIELRTSSKFRNVVGGERQIAILENGHVKADNVMETPSLSSLKAVGISYMLGYSFRNNIGESINRSRTSDLTSIYINGYCSGSTMQLDGSAFSDSTFANCTITYDDLAPSIFSKNNVVVGSTLLLGPAVRSDDSFVKKLTEQFPEIKVIRRK